MSLEDRAQEHEAKMWEQRNAPRPHRPTYTPEQTGYGPAACGECDEPMPSFRRANGWTLCTGCQSLVEAGKLRR